MSRLFSAPPSSVLNSFLCAFAPLSLREASSKEDCVESFLCAIAPLRLRAASSKVDCVESFPCVFAPLCPCVTLFSFLCASVSLSLCVNLFSSLCAFASLRLCVTPFPLGVEIFWHFQRQPPLFPPSKDEIGRRRLFPAFPPKSANSAPSSRVVAVENSRRRASLSCSRRSRQRQCCHFRQKRRAPDWL
jgi:hypothetical protein